MKAALKKIYRLEGLGDFGPGLVSGAINRFKEIAEEKKQNPPDPAWPTSKPGQLGSFRKGLQALPNAAARYLGEDRVRTGWALEGVKKTAEDEYEATFKTDEGMKTIKAKSVVLTVPTRVACKVAADVVPAAKRLEDVYSPTVAGVSMAYKKEWFKPLPNAEQGKPLNG
eukprot:scaffold109_cov252-Pinguiococcus_pyrenoidosus.AAC.50